MKTTDIYTKLARAAESRDATAAKAVALAADLNALDAKVSRSFMVDAAMAKIDDQARKISSDVVASLRSIGAAANHAPVARAGGSNAKELPVLRTSKPNAASALSELVKPDTNPLALLVAALGDNGRAAVVQWLEGCAASAGCPSKAEEPAAVSAKSRAIAAEIDACMAEVAELDAEIRELNTQLHRAQNGQPEPRQQVEDGLAPTPLTYVDASMAPQ